MNDFGWGYEVSSAHFHYFVACCKHWIKFLRLSDWEVSFDFVEAEEDSPKASMTCFDQHNRLCAITLYDHWDVDTSDYYLWKSAFHEVLEVLLIDLHCMAEARSWNYDKYDREHHRVIRMLENSVFGGMWDDGHKLFNFQPEPEVGRISRPSLLKMDYHEPLPGTGVQCDKQEPGGSADSLSPLQRIKGWWNEHKTTRLSRLARLWRTS